MSTFKWFASFALATTIASTLSAETHCPGNVASVPFRLVKGHQIILSVSVNHTGPYHFLLDTGTQITIVDPSLAAQLHLDTDGAAVVAGAGSRQSASLAELDLLEAGSHFVARPKVLVYDLQPLQSADLNIQGVLGEDFLEHFDMLIDNAHSLLCLDDSGVMRSAMKGPRIPLVVSIGPEQGAPTSSLLIVSVRLSDATRPVRLMLDSGANAPILYNTAQYLSLPLSQTKSLRGSSVDGKQRMFSALPLQDVKIASLALSGVPFFSLGGAQQDASKKGFDGVLTTGLFRRVFIDHADHFAVLEPSN
jgi:Aspartyl protease